VSETGKSERRKTNAVTGISLLVALFTPVGISLISNPSGVFVGYLLWLFGTVFIGSPIPIDGGGMVPPTVIYTAGILLIPLIALRLLFVLQIFRAYNGRTSGRAALYVGVLSELYLVIVNVPNYISRITATFSAGSIYVPLPILLLVGALLIWRFPPFVPSTPWETPEESESVFTPAING